MEQLKRRLAQLEREVGADVYRQCQRAIRKFSRGGGWIVDDPYIEATVRKLRMVSHDSEVLRRYMSAETAHAKAHAKFFGHGERARGQPPLAADFKKMENELMCILTASGSKAGKAANRTFLFVECHLLKPSTRYSARAILERWRKSKARKHTLIP